MVIRDFISLVRNSLDSITTDNYISGQYIYEVATSYAKLFTKRESDSRKLFKNTSAFTFIDCLELKPSTISECTNILLPCKSVMKSVKKLPEIYLSNYGSLIMVMNLTRDKVYDEVNPISYKSVRDQKYTAKNKGYFWIQNGYIVIPDSEVEAVSVMYLGPDLEGNATTSSSCKILDRELPVLDYLLAQVIEATVKHISTSKSITRDENANLDERA